MSTIMNITPVIPGHIISASSNVESAMFMIINYLDSTYDLQAADAKLEQSITNAEAEKVQAFEEGLIAPGTNYSLTATNYIYELEHDISPSDPNYSEEASNLTMLYTNANAANQADVKVMDGNNSTAQNTLSQNSQGQQGLMQTMGSINGVAGNLTRLIQG